MAGIHVSSSTSTVLFLKPGFLGFDIVICL
jgi:hypothetical protein